jgi:BlaI family penicillinase repressor
MVDASNLDHRDMEILQQLWQHGPLKPGELQQRLSFPMKNPALRWLLNDLVARGQLTRKKVGKAFVYSAAVERRSLLEAWGGKLRDILFGGSALAMIGELIDVQKLSPEDIDYLKTIARGQKKPNKAKSKKKF